MQIIPKNLKPLNFMLLYRDGTTMAVLKTRHGAILAEAVWSMLIKHLAFEAKGHIQTLEALKSDSEHYFGVPYSEIEPVVLSLLDRQWLCPTLYERGYIFSPKLRSKLDSAYARNSRKNVPPTYTKYLEATTPKPDGNRREPTEKPKNRRIIDKNPTEIAETRRKSPKTDGNSTDRERETPLGGLKSLSIREISNTSVTTESYALEGLLSLSPPHWKAEEKTCKIIFGAMTNDEKQTAFECIHAAKQNPEFASLAQYLTVCRGNTST